MTEETEVTEGQDGNDDDDGRKLKGRHSPGWKNRRGQYEKG